MKFEISSKCLRKNRGSCATRCSIKNYNRLWQLAHYGRRNLGNLVDQLKMAEGLFGRRRPSNTSIITLHFDKELPLAFFAGETIAGKVCIPLREPLKCRQVAVRFKGYVSVSFTESVSELRDGQTTTNTRTRKARETYFDNTTIVWGNGQKAALPEGDHMFAFSFTLPPNLPSSFQGKHGRVYYVCKAEVDLPWKLNHTCEVPFSVTPIVDLNNVTDGDKNIVMETQETMTSYCCFTGGTIFAKATLDKRCYVPGESIKINLEINNTSSQSIRKSIARLKQHVTYSAENSSSKDKLDLGSVQFGSLSARKSGSWNDVALLVPPVPPTGLGGCRIINVKYIIEVQVYSGNYLKGMNMKEGIKIGTIPLRNTLNGMPSMAGGRLAVPMECPDFGQYPMLPPPSYEEATMLSEGAAQASGSKSAVEDFKPHCIVYRQYLQPPGANENNPNMSCDQRL